MNIILTSLTCAFGAISMGACTQESPITNPPVQPTEEVVIERGTFAKGADVSWLTQQEHEGYVFYNQSRQQKECMQLLRDDCGVNSIRLRVWVNPADGWNDAYDVILKAKRATDLGMRVMIDFHFSDSWADPGQQVTPAAWANLDIDGLCEAMVTHVQEVLNGLKIAGVEPEWVQIGNETRNGMMYPLGNINDYPQNFAKLVTAAHKAIKGVFPEAKTIVHVDQGNVWYRYTHTYGSLADNGAEYDMIGVSVYPEPDSWKATVDDLLANLSKAKTTYGKETMVCEVGMDATQVEASTAMMEYLTQAAKGGLSQGVFYWEPQAPLGYNGGYNKGCFLNDSPTTALDCFKE